MLLNLATVARVAVNWVSKWSHADHATWLLIAVVLALRVWYLLLQELLIVILLLLVGIVWVLLLMAM